MEIDLAQLDSSADGSDLLRAEICIIGGGIAGLILAHKLGVLGHDVLVLEAGNFSAGEGSPAEPLIQDGHPHPGTMESRVSALGGTSIVWGGQLLPLPADARWPVTAQELLPYTLEAERLLGVDDLPYDAQSFFEKLNRPLPGLLGELQDLDFSLSKFAPFSHRNLAQTIGRRLRNQSNVRIAVNARVDELLLSPSRDRIEAAIVHSSIGKTFRVRAEQLVVAAGTIDTVRLLLASRAIAAEGIGNAHDQVGRNFHDHLTVVAATLSAPARRQLLRFRPWIHRRTTHAFKFSANADLRDKLNLTPVLAHLTIDEPANSGVGVIRNVLRSRQQGSAAQSMRAALPDLPRAALDGVLLMGSAVLQRRRYVSPRATVQLRLNAAQRRPSGSRVTLTQDRRPVLNWRIEECELATLRRFTSYLRERLNIDGIDWESSLLGATSSAIPNLDDARHAMGGACMGTNPHDSVVDRELRVHGLNNLFIASAAVFPDGSPQLPTLSLMAITLRLADHLHQRL